MKTSNCLKLALLNLKNYKKFYFKVTLPIILLSFLLLFSSLYATNLENKIDDRYNRFYSRYYGEINTETQLNDTLLNLAKIDGELNDIKKTVKIENKEFTFYKDLTMEIDGKKNEGRYDYIRPDFSLTFVTNGSHISKNEEDELKYRKNRNILLYGNYDIEGNNAVINQLLFEFYGIEFDESIIGKTITFYKNEEKYFDIIVSGVTTKDIFSNSMYLNTLIGMSTENDLYKRNSDLKKLYSYQFYFKDFLSAQKSLGLIKMVFPNEKLHFPYDLEIKLISTLYSQKTIINKFVKVILIVLLLVFFLNMIFNIKINADKQKGYIGIMKSLGVTDIKMYFILLFEFLIIVSISYIISIILSIVGLNLINFIFKSMSFYKGATIVFDLTGFGSIILIYAGIFFIISVVLSFISYIMTAKKSGIELLSNS